MPLNTTYARHIHLSHWRAYREREKHWAEFQSATFSTHRRDQLFFFPTRLSFTFVRGSFNLIASRAHRVLCFASYTLSVLLALNSARNTRTHIWYSVFFSAREQKLRKLFRKERREEKNQLTNIAMPCMEPVWKCKRQIISDCDRSRKTRKHRFHVSLSSWKKMMWN